VPRARLDMPAVSLYNAEYFTLQVIVDTLASWPSKTTKSRNEYEAPQEAPGPKD